VILLPQRQGEFAPAFFIAGSIFRRFLTVNLIEKKDLGKKLKKIKALHIVV
jgi:hypothetical protein